MSNVAKHYDIIKAPVITEKATLGQENNTYTFKVAIDATKPEIKAAVESIFDVTVKSVNTVRQQGKIKRFRGIRGQRAEYKKAMVKLAEGSSIDVTSGV
ncbi:50S ribosomal protein L23 [Temperatibacter marinus]|uniref:Large ribosomal subunit protein uL23 n=1 Tax=Temperatibacter marinus TaxID=1456591 RepID=A0AA52EDI6_9PROT|nr:50S ribosomal protein L23 [Temperatibacter marinus]WND02791.1 50S ribosomal protein L23 [Temperatibacter marinus]